MADERERRLDQLLDRQDIHDCLMRMSRGSDRCDRELFLSAIHADAVLTAGPFVGGPKDLYDWSEAFQKETYPQSFHKLLNHSCDLDGDTATPRPTISSSAAWARTTCLPADATSIGSRSVAASGAW